MSREELNEILENHKHWLNEDCEGWENNMANRKDNATNKCPNKCKNCECRKIVTSFIVPHNFCTKLNASFCGEEPDNFFNCGK